MSYVVSIHDSLSGDPGAMIIQSFETIEQAYAYGADSLDEIAQECQDERTTLAPLFRALAELMRRQAVTHAGLDGYEVLISQSTANDEAIITSGSWGSWLRYKDLNAGYGDAPPAAEAMGTEEGFMFLQYLLSDADPKYMVWIGDRWAKWNKMMKR